MKKQWISVKCGLSRDPKHRQAMGESVWLFLHILDVASWDDGIAHDWKDEAAAEDMGMPVRTLREHRRRLDELGYITCKQKQYTQDIIVHNWTNPREYSGQIYNQGDIKKEASKFQGDTQDYIQGDTQGNRKHVTPTYNSNNKESNTIKQKPDLIDAMIEQGKQAQAIQEACNFFEQTFGFGALTWDTKPVWRKFAKWIYTTYSADAGALKDYVTWRNGKGQYKGAMTNTAIRRDPQIFMDTGWPTFLSYASMYPNGENKVVTEPKGFEAGRLFLERHGVSNG
jgi:hypothetical protein